MIRARLTFENTCSCFIDNGKKETGKTSIDNQQNLEIFRVLDQLLWEEGRWATYYSSPFDFNIQELV